MRNLPVQSLEFEAIKQNFKDFLKGNEKYKDFNFEASGISTLLNIQSYQTHIIGFFVKMLLDEAFVDSAHTRQAQLSHAKRVGYIPKGNKSASAEVSVKVSMPIADEPSSRAVEIPRGASFASVNSTADKRVFTVLDGMTIYNRTVDGGIASYTSDPLVIYEGEISKWNFVVDESVMNQKFVIRDPDIDIDTIRIYVRETPTSANFTEYHLAEDVNTITPDSNVFYVSTDENGFYQVFFGGNIFGREPSNGNGIEATYISCNGESGNGAKAFTFNAPIGFPYTDVTTETLSPSDGGSAPQTTEELRFAIPAHWRAQNRAVTDDDYLHLLLTKFRNIDSINVWGGEKNIVRDYGKTYISIKPKNSDRLTALARTQIRNDIIKNRGVTGVDPVFVDPDFVETDVTIMAKYDIRKTNKSLPELNQMVRDRVSEYNVKYLSKFTSMLSDAAMLEYIKAGDPSAFITLYSTKVIRKNHTHLHNSSSTNQVVFGNSLVPGSIVSGDIRYSPATSEPFKIKDDSKGNLFLKSASGTSIAVGKVDYNTGILSYNIPTYSRIVGYESATSGSLSFKATPSIPDVNTYLNNIVRISSVRVING